MTGPGRRGHRPYGAAAARPGPPDAAPGTAPVTRTLMDDADRRRLGLAPIEWLAGRPGGLDPDGIRIRTTRVVLGSAVLAALGQPPRIRVGVDPLSGALILEAHPTGFRVQRDHRDRADGFLRSKHLVPWLAARGWSPGLYHGKAERVGWVIRRQKGDSHAEDPESPAVPDVGSAVAGSTDALASSAGAV